MPYIAGMAKRLALLLVLVALAGMLLPAEAAWARAHHDIAASTDSPTDPDCPRHAEEPVPQDEHRSCCTVGCSMTALPGLPMADMPRPAGGRHELPAPALAPLGHLADTLLRPPR